MPKGKRIAVVGAGISGLTCAYELQKAGNDVTVFESSDRVGGRMGTRMKDGFYFDTGTNFFIGEYSHTKALCEELGIGERWQRMAKAKHGLFRNGKIHWLSLDPKNFLSAYSFLSPVAKIRLVLMAIMVYRKFSGTDFFDLSNCPPELDTTSAYDFALRWGGREVADALIDGYNATYEFHSSKEMSVTGLIALFGLMLKDKEGFAMWHTTGGEMQVLPDALAKKLNVRLNTFITLIKATDNNVILSIAKNLSGSFAAAQDDEMKFDAVVLATTADVTQKIYTNPTPQQRALLKSVHYSSTVTLSFRVPLECVKDLAIITVPHIESKIISSYSNESTKGTIVNGQTLVNVWIWDSYASKLLKKNDQEIFEIVATELKRVCPPLATVVYVPPHPDPARIALRSMAGRPLPSGRGNFMVAHDLQRLPISMPKYEPGYITRVAEFWKNGQAPHGAGQGANNVWFCGDYLNAPWVEGSVRCGQKVAAAISTKYRGTRPSDV